MIASNDQLVQEYMLSSIYVSLFILFYLPINSSLFCQKFWEMHDIK